PRSQLMVPSAATSPALRWWASMRAVGLLGGRASSLDLDAAVDLLARGLRGRRRRRAVARRLGALLRELADRARDGELDPPAVADTLDRLLQVDVGDVGLDAAPVVDLALWAADPDLLERVGIWLGGDAGRQLCELAVAEHGVPTFAVVDLETGGTEIGRASCRDRDGTLSSSTCKELSR